MQNESIVDLEVIYEDDWLVAINKPNGLLVHRSTIATDATTFALQTLRDQLGKYVFPVHRIDRKTSGVLLFALNKNISKAMQKMFSENKVQKSYLAIVRGYAPEKDEIDYPLKKENGQYQEAKTIFQTLARAELEVPFGKHKTSRYSLVRVSPITGRMHQIRKHLAHIHYPIIGDRPHGCNKQNRLFKERWNMTTMLLHALEISFEHPTIKESVHIKANPQNEFMRVIDIMNWKDILQSKI